MTGGSGFCRGSSARVLMIDTILVIGTITIRYVSSANISAPATMTSPVNVVVSKFKIAFYFTLFRLLTRT
jgi:hypothetical protein